MDRGCEVDVNWQQPPVLGFDLFDAVRDRKVKTSVSQPGTFERAFAYRFEIRSGDSNKNFRRTCALIEPPFDVPHTTISPHSLQTLPTKPTDGADTSILVPGFDDQNRVQTYDETFSRSLPEPGLGAWLLTTHARPGTNEYEPREGRLLRAAPKVDGVEALIDFHYWAAQIRGRMAESLGDRSPGPAE